LARLGRQVSWVLLPMAFARTGKTKRSDRFDGSADYWEKRYKEGGDSGVGSYGNLARYKAQVINSFIGRKGIRTVIEFGCGDGTQLSYYEIPGYTGIDVSEAAISMSRKRFSRDPTKRFLSHREFEANRGKLVPADMTLSVDVIYHLVEDDVFETHIRDLFQYASRFVMIYSTNFDKAYENPHQVDRKFTPYIEEHMHGFELIETIVNPYKGDDTMSDFYIYERIGSEAECTS
jgi:cyclopropane fatty-acyl-phospholipid synthase-like methyltransferase